jgi:hypothetical protein
MGKTTRILKELEVATGDATHVEVSIYYSKGGMNYFTGNNEARGLYLSVTPVSLTTHEGGFKSRSFKAFSGVKQHIKSMGRFNEKVLNEEVVDEDMLKKLLNHVLEKGKITLK